MTYRISVVHLFLRWTGDEVDRLFQKHKHSFYGRRLSPCKLYTSYVYVKGYFSNGQFPENVVIFYLILLEPVKDMAHYVKRKTLCSSAVLKPATDSDYHRKSLSCTCSSFVCPSHSKYFISQMVVIKVFNV